MEEESAFHCSLHAVIGQLWGQKPCKPRQLWPCRNICCRNCDSSVGVSVNPGCSSELLTDDVDNLHWAQSSRQQGPTSTTTSRAADSVWTLTDVRSCWVISTETGGALSTWHGQAEILLKRQEPTVSAWVTDYYCMTSQCSSIRETYNMREGGNKHSMICHHNTLAALSPGTVYHTRFNKF